MASKKVHFIGIGGVSMSALAKLCLKRNWKVSGSDVKESLVTQELSKMGATIFIGHSAEHVCGADVVVYSGAIDPNNIERKVAEKTGVRLVERSVFLGEIATGYKHTIAVTGTHGKTTTTAMIGWVLQCADFCPTIHIGGVSHNFDSNMIIGDKNYFVTEGCEYRKSMLSLFPEVGVITSIEKDHTDCYKTLDELKDSFDTFAHQCQYVVSFEDMLVGKYQEKIYCTLGEENVSDATTIWRAKRIKYVEDYTIFDVEKDGEYYGYFVLKMIGEYNVKNALISIAVADIYHISYPIIYDSLKSFTGVQRRCELLGYKRDKIVVADYAHHPTAIQSTIKMIKARYGKVLCLFQPHTYSRTRDLLDEFVTCFDEAHRVVILPTYPAREELDMRGDASVLYTKIKKKKKSWITQCREVLSYWIDECDVVLILGAGDIYEDALDWLEEK